MTAGFWRALVSGITLTAWLPGWRTAHAQSAGSAEPRWPGHLAVLAGNATLGALTAGILQELRGGSFSDGFARGALGGSIGYLGKRVAVEDFAGAGLLGREVAAVGTSIVRNASEARPSFAELYLPLGPLPVRALVTLDGDNRFRPQVDASALGWLVYGLTESRVGLDLGESISSGAPVFTARRRSLLNDRGMVSGSTAERTIFLSDPTARQFDPEHTLRHERVHVLQQDFTLTAWSDPFNRFLLGRLSLGPNVASYVTVDGVGWLFRLLEYGLFPGDRVGDAPSELEAEFLPPAPFARP